MLATTAIFLLALLALSIPVAATLGWLGIILEQFFAGGMPLHLALGEVVWQNAIEYVLVAIPLFILLGEILLACRYCRTHVQRDGAMVVLAARWHDAFEHRHLRDFRGLIRFERRHCGPSRPQWPTLKSNAGATTSRFFSAPWPPAARLGILIPPSINLIIYGLLTDTSVPQLYLAGFIPGVILASLFMLTVLVAVTYRKSWGGEKVNTSWSERWKVLPDLLPPLGIFLVVVGSIYAGIATPTEAAFGRRHGIDRACLGNGYAELGHDARGGRGYAQDHGDGDDHHLCCPVSELCPCRRRHDRATGQLH